MSKLIRISLFVTMILLNGCTPRIEVVTPDKPIVIDLNIKIDHNINIKVDRDIENLIETNPTLFSS